MSSPGPHAYVVTNALAGLAAGSFTWTGGVTTDRDKLNDGRMDSRFGAGTLASGAQLVIDMGAATSLIGFATLNFSMPSLAAAVTPKVLIEADTSNTFATAVTAKALTSLYVTTKPRNKDHVLQFPAVSKRWWRLTWSWTGGGSFAFFIGELFAYSSITQLSRRTIYGSGEAKTRIVQDLEFQNGEVRSLFMGGPIRQLNQAWGDFSSSELDELDNLYDACNGGALPMLWVDSYESQAGAAAASEQQCCYGKITKHDFGFKQNDFGIYQPDGFNIRSLGREAGA